MDIQPLLNQVSHSPFCISNPSSAGGGENFTPPHLPGSQGRAVKVHVKSLLPAEKSVSKLQKDGEDRKLSQ